MAQSDRFSNNQPGTRWPTTLTKVTEASAAHQQSTAGFDRRRLLGLVAAAGVAGTSVLLGSARRAFAASLPLAELAVITNTAAAPRAHLYPDVTTMLAHGTGMSSGTPTTTLEFFDSQGSRLAPVLDHKGQLVGLRDSGDGPDPEAVIDRLQAVVRDLEQTIREEPSKIESLKVTPEEALARLPRLDSVDIETAFDRCRSIFGHLPTGGHTIEHSTDPWHNFWVHGIF